MKRVHLEITHNERDVRNYTGRRIQQGEIYVGSEKQGTILKSCLCIGFWNNERKVGAISHVTGFNPNGGHTPHGALDAIVKRLRNLGLQPENCQCFLVGGADAARHVYDSVATELQKRGWACQELDVLGDYHRKLVLDPETGTVLLYRKSGREMANESKNRYSADDGKQCFHDPKRRLITGASLFFRNEGLIDCLKRTALPELTRNSKQLHFWCAGCSIGMEAYSVVMITLDYLERNNISADDFKVLGTDISPDAIAKARGAHYPLHSRAAQKYGKLFERYTEQPGPREVIMGRELRRRCHFMERDITQGSRKHLFELVICDHVMQYFKPEVQRTMLAPLAKAVQPGGFAYISSPTPTPTEELCGKYGFKQLARAFYKKL